MWLSNSTTDSNIQISSYNIWLSIIPNGNENDWCCRPRFCTVRLYWARDNEMNFVVNHAPGAGSIARLVGQQSSALPLYLWCPIMYPKISLSTTYNLATKPYRSLVCLSFIFPLSNWPLIPFCNSSLQSLIATTRSLNIRYRCWLYPTESFSNICNFYKKISC